MELENPHVDRANFTEHLEILPDGSGFELLTAIPIDSRVFFRSLEGYENQQEDQVDKGYRFKPAVQFKTPYQLNSI